MASVQLDLRHRRAGHCGSGALRDLLEFHGLAYGDEPAREALAFGPGAGLGLLYFGLPPLAPPIAAPARAPPMPCEPPVMTATFCSLLMICPVLKKRAGRPIAAGDPSKRAGHGYRINQQTAE